MTAKDLMRRKKEGLTPFQNMMLHKHPNIFNEDITHSSFNRGLGAAINTDVRNQMDEVHKEAARNGVPVKTVVYEILERHKPDMIGFLESKKIAYPKNPNALALASIIAKWFADGQKAVEAHYYDEGHPIHESDALNYFMGSQIVGAVADPNSPFHYSNQAFTQDEHGNIAVSSYDDVPTGQTNLLVSQGIESLGGAASQIPGIGNILGPIMQGAGSLFGALGQKNRDRAAELDKQRQEDMMRLMAEQNAGAMAQKNSMVMYGGIAVIGLILVFVLFKS